MLKRLRALRTNDNGFTLIELLIVIVILGILSGIVVFAVGAFNDRGQVAACQSDKKNVEVAVEAYRAKNTGYPTGADSAARFALLTTGGFLREAPGSANGYTIAISTDTGTVTSTGVC